MLLWGSLKLAPIITSLLYNYGIASFKKNDAIIIWTKVSLRGPFCCKPENLMGSWGLFRESEDFFREPAGRLLLNKRKVLARFNLSFICGQQLLETQPNLINTCHAITFLIVVDSESNLSHLWHAPSQTPHIVFGRLGHMKHNSLNGSGGN